MSGRKSGRPSTGPFADDKLSFGAWLKQYRMHLDLTQQMIADLVGYSAETIRKIEANRLRPSRELSEQLAVVLKLPEPAHCDFVDFARGRVASIPASLREWRALPGSECFPVNYS